MKRTLLLLLPIAILAGIISTIYSAYQTFIIGEGKWNVIEFISLFIITVFFLIAYLQIKKSKK